MDVDVHDHVVNEDIVVEALFSNELIILHSATPMMLRTSDGLKLVVGNHIVDVDLSCPKSFTGTIVVDDCSTGGRVVVYISSMLFS